MSIRIIWKSFNCSNSIYTILYTAKLNELQQKRTEARIYMSKSKNENQKPYTTTTKTGWVTQRSTALVNSLFFLYILYYIHFYMYMFWHHIVYNIMWYIIYSFFFLRKAYKSLWKLNYAWLPSAKPPLYTRESAFQTYIEWVGCICGCSFSIFTFYIFSWFSLHLFKKKKNKKQNWASRGVLFCFVSLYSKKYIYILHLYVRVNLKLLFYILYSMYIVYYWTK